MASRVRRRVARVARAARLAPANAAPLVTRGRDATTLRASERPPGASGLADQRAFHTVRVAGFEPTTSSSRRAGVRIPRLLCAVTSALLRWSSSVAVVALGAVVVTQIVTQGRLGTVRGAAAIAEHERLTEDRGNGGRRPSRSDAAGAMRRAGDGRMLGSRCGAGTRGGKRPLRGQDLPMSSTSWAPLVTATASSASSSGRWNRCASTVRQGGQPAGRITQSAAAAPSTRSCHTPSPVTWFAIMWPSLR